MSTNKKAIPILKFGLNFCVQRHFLILSKQKELSENYQPDYRNSLFKQIEEAEQAMDLMLEPPVEEVEESVLEPEDLETVSR